MRHLKQSSLYLLQTEWLFLALWGQDICASFYGIFPTKPFLQKYKTFLAFLLFIANEMDDISLVLLQK